MMFKFINFRRSVQAESCVKNYVQKCLRKTAKQAANVLAFGVAKTNKQYCTNRKRKNALIKAGKCGNNAKVLANKCMNKYTTTLISIVTEKDVRKRVPMGCW